MKRRWGSRKPTVVIVGAGIAGLAAAKTLMGNGVMNVVLLEGRQRVGGRIFTDFLGPDGKPINVGAHFIHGCDTDGCNLLLDFVRRHNISTVDATSVKEVFYTGDAPGQTVAKETVDRASDLSKRFEELILTSLEPSRTLSSAVQVTPALSALPAPERKVLEQMVADKHAYAAAPEDISVAGVRDQLKRHHHRTVDDHSCGDRILPAGFGRVVEHLVHGLARYVKLGHAVRRIDQRPDGCVVTSVTGETYNADVVIVTVPLGVLKAGSIAFEPALSEAKQRAIERLGFGIQNRVYLTFQSIFWDTEAQTFHCVSDSRFRFFNLSSYGLGPLLSVMIMPPYSKEIEQRSDQEIVTEVIEVLTRIFGSISSITSHKVTRWGSDPFARGSFSFIPSGSSMKEVLDLALPEGRIFFAGEATSDEEMQMARGAFTSGIRAGHEATTLLHRLLVDPARPPAEPIAAPAPAPPVPASDGPRHPTAEPPAAGPSAPADAAAAWQQQQQQQQYAALRPPGMVPPGFGGWPAQPYPAYYPAYPPYYPGAVPPMMMYYGYPTPPPNQ